VVTGTGIKMLSQAPGDFRGLMFRGQFVNNLQLAVVGGGPAGLRAAETAAVQGVKVTLFDAKPSVGRKFWWLEKEGLNLTHEEPLHQFIGRYRGSADIAERPSHETFERWAGLLGGFGPEALRAWAAGLGVATFVATSGRVYPVE
jgi:predicted flavoprotein YhiN